MLFYFITGLPFLTGIHRIPNNFLVKGSNAELRRFLCCQPEQDVKQIIALSVIWDNKALIIT